MLTSEDDKYYFDLRKAGKIYVSKLFRYSEVDVPIRNVKIVFDDADDLDFGEIKGALQIRISTKGKNQVAAIVSQDSKKINRISLVSYREKKSGQFIATTKDSFTFRGDEFEKLVNFLKAMEFIDFSNIDNFQIEDQSTPSARKAIVDRSDASLIHSLKELSKSARSSFLTALSSNLSHDEINILLGRRRALNEFNAKLNDENTTEKEWQEFFNQNQWIFGYGLDYRVMKIFDREMAVGQGGTANREKPMVDFLTTFTNFTALVEIKTPRTPIFHTSRKGRSGIFGFSSEFVEAVSQVLEQKAEWLSFGQSRGLFNRDGSEQLKQRTRDAKIILIIGSKECFNSSGTPRDQEIKLDTFELFRRENRNIEILTFDELYERAEFIVRHHQEPLNA
ncbi:MAG: DUF4263 domain-containing protein [Aestuariivirga sp.]|nr:DUF4263 domain-containing protein [Aestuariivirga sp.]